MKIVILHGTDGSPDGNWFPWLKSELEKLGHEVFVPKFPTPEGQNIESWCEVLRNETPYFDEETILIGHSTGATYLLSVLESLENDEQMTGQRVAAGIFVSGYISPIGNKQYDEWNKPFYDKDFNWGKIRAGAKKIFVLHGDNDPYVPREQAEKLAQNLGVEPIIIKNGGHLNAESGYTVFPEILEIINLVALGEK